MQVLGKRHIEVSCHSPKSAIWCFPCNHFAILDNNGKCECCKNKTIVRARQFHKELVIIGKLVNENRPLIESFIRDPYIAEHMPGFSIRIGTRNYLINLKHIAEYYKKCETMNFSEFNALLKNIKNESMLLMPGVKVK